MQIYVNILYSTVLMQCTGTTGSLLHTFRIFVTSHFHKFQHEHTKNSLKTFYGVVILTSVLYLHRIFDESAYIILIVCLFLVTSLYLF